MENDPSPISLAEIYLFLAQSMRYPEADWFDDHYFSVLLTILDELHWLEEVDALEKARSSSDDFLEDVQVEHTRLFINAIPHVPAAPYASVHYKGDGTLYGTIAEKTKQFYAEKGFELKHHNDTADHIVYELEFLALLAKDHDDQGSREFLDTLFVPWFSSFHGKVREEAHHPFYRVVTKLIDFFTREEL